MSTGRCRRPVFCFWYEWGLVPFIDVANDWHYTPFFVSGMNGALPRFFIA
jgi:hypothetical protein